MLGRGWGSEFCRYLHSILPNICLFWLCKLLGQSEKRTLGQEDEHRILHHLKLRPFGARNVAMRILLGELISALQRLQELPAGSGGVRA